MSDRDRGSVRDDSGSRAGGPQVYLVHFRVRFHELDALGHVNNATYLNFLEQAAIDHAAALGFGEERLRSLGGHFVARRHEIDYLRPAFAGDRLRVVTWVGQLRGARAVRHYEVYRLPPGPAGGQPARDQSAAPAGLPPPAGELIVRARTEWAFVDALTARPRRIPAEIVAAFPVRAAPRL